MSKFIDRTGKRYGRLTVLEKAKSENGIVLWKCLCDCGEITYVRSNNLQSGGVKSCGCLRKTSLPTLRHNMSKNRLYHTWASMKARCNCATHKSYKDYGGRGIAVCDEWNNSFDTFMAWALSSGYSDNMTIERKDVNCGYCPENCIWISSDMQAQNRRSCKFFSYNGKRQNLMQWCNELNLSYKQVHNRIYKLGWNFERAISEPVHVDKRNRKKG